MITEVDMRRANQYAVELIFRFPLKKENFVLAGLYNYVKTSLSFNPVDISIDRSAGSIGWFITKNIMLKAESVSQLYKNFISTDIR